MENRFVRTLSWTRCGMAHLDFIAGKGPRYCKVEQFLSRSRKENCVKISQIENNFRHIFGLRLFFGSEWWETCKIKKSVILFRGFLINYSCLLISNKGCISFIAYISYLYEKKSAIQMSWNFVFYVQMCSRFQEANSRKILSVNFGFRFPPDFTYKHISKILARKWETYRFQTHFCPGRTGLG